MLSQPNLAELGVGAELGKNLSKTKSNNVNFVKEKIKYKEGILLMLMFVYASILLI